MFPDQIQQIIDHYFHEEVRTLKELVQIESVVAPWEERSGVVMPFGAGVHRAYQYMLEKGRENDFAIEDAEHYGGHIQLNHTVEERGKPEKTMGIVCHLDTVPLGNGWQHDPLSGEEDQGRLYGRGTNDDKGPAVAAFYAMKAVAECSVPRRNNVRLILGLDEETDWIGMEQYKKAVDPPDFGFTPDADFPAIHGEKGILVFELARKFERPASEGLELRKVEGGSAPNMVADRARAVIHAKSERTYHAVQELAVQESQNSPLSFRTKKTGKSMEIVCIGKSAHGAHPDLGENAITGLMAFLSQLHFANEDVNAFIAFYHADQIGRASCRERV